MKDKVPATIEVIFCVDQSHGGHIVSGAEDWISVDMLDGCSMDDNGILLPNDIDSGIYRGKLRMLCRSLFDVGYYNIGNNS